MSVKVKISAVFQPATGGVKEARVDCKTVGECLTQVAKKYPNLEKMFFDEKDKLSGFLTVFVNEECVRDNLADTPVKSGDEILPVMIIEGG